VRLRVCANRAHRDESFLDVLRRPLPFKIPVVNKRHVVKYPNIFEYGEAEYDVAVDAWVGAVGCSLKSERTVIGDDLLWQRTLQLLCNLALVLSERDASSEIYQRPGFTALCLGALVLKAEAKCDVKDMGTTIKDMIDRFHPCARLLLPDGCAEIPGIATSLQGASIHRIYCAEGTFQQELVKDYVLLTEMGRVEFICDIFKIAMWIEAQVGPVQHFHLVPDVRVRTRNGHYITLKKDGVLKEFRYGQDYTAAISHIKAIYEARLPNVEHGVTHRESVTITRIGRRLKEAIYLQGLDKREALDGARSGVQQLHAIGMAHCDICVDNIFVELETGVVFLGDLEYCRLMGDAPPAGIRRGDPAARTAQELDDLQLARLRDELARL
jgi:hypothetical protein